MVLSAFLIQGCTTKRITLSGSPDTNGMVIVLFDKMKWREDRTFKLDRDHHLIVTDCKLQLLPAGGPPWKEFNSDKAIPSEIIVLEVGSFFTTTTSCFVFSELQPGRYHLIRAESVYGLSEPITEYKYSVFHPNKYPQLTFYVPLGGVIYLGEVFYSLEKGEVTEVSISRDRKIEVLEALLKSDPEGQWAQTLRAELGE
jgi:hypothetical protein